MDHESCAAWLGCLTLAGAALWRGGGDLVEFVEEFPQGVPGDDVFAVRLGDPGLPPAGAGVDHYVGVIAPELVQPQDLIGFVRRDPQRRADRPAGRVLRAARPVQGIAAAHYRVSVLGGLRSRRSIRYVLDLRRRLAAYGDQPQVREFSERAARLSVARAGPR